MVSNNGLYPDLQEWQGRYLTANLDYPQLSGQDVWPFPEVQGLLAVSTALACVAPLKEYFRGGRLTENWVKSDAFHNLGTMHVHMFNSKISQCLGEGMMCLFHRGWGNGTRG